MKRVLVISYYWPPAGGISVLRSLKIVKYLREFGWEPVVYKPSNAHYPYLDAANFKDVPEGIEILEKPIIEPFILFKLLTGRSKKDGLNDITKIKDKRSSWLDQIGIMIRGNFFIPDARALWIRPSVKFLSDYLVTKPVDAIFTDGPPHTNTRIGYLLSKKFKIPWLADFQDPWTQVDYYSQMRIGPIAHFLHRRMERAVFKQASKITIASSSWKKDLEGIGANNVDVLYYGFDEDDFSKLKPEKSKTQFNIVHIGLMGYDRNPSKILRNILPKQSSFSIHLQLAGQVDSEVLAELNSIPNLTIDYYGVIARSGALKLAIDADLLLLPLNKASNAQGRLPGKLYEYLRTYNPILAIGPTNSDAAEILCSTNTGICIDYDTVEKRINFLEHLILAKQIKLGSEVSIDGTLKDHFRPITDKINEYSNRNQTKQLAAYLNEML